MLLRIPFGKGAPGAPAYGTLDADLAGDFPFTAFRHHSGPLGDPERVHAELARIDAAVHALSCERIQAHHPDLRLMPEHAACWHPVGPVWCYDGRRRRWVPVLDLAWQTEDGSVVRDAGTRRERRRQRWR